jgi:hypothetical protein
VIFYFLPGHGIFGGIKAGYQMVDALNSVGLPACVASPGGLAAQWFSSRAPVVDRDEVLASWKADDWAVFSLPHDYGFLRPLIDRLVYHCQGTDPLIDAFLSDSSMRAITSWNQATEYLLDRGKNSHVVPPALPSVFYYSGERKQTKTLSFMPRRGAEFVHRVMEGQDQWATVSIDGVSENTVARTLKHSTHFLASSAGEWFGMPALEAMAAGCVVLSPPVVGADEYLIDGETAIVGDSAKLRHYLEGSVGNKEGEKLMAQRAMAAAHRYSPAKQRASLVSALSEGLFS